MWQICVIVNQVSADFWISERTPAVCGTLQRPILFCLPSTCDRIFSTEMRWLRNKGSMWSCKLTALSDYPLTTTIKSSTQSYPTTYKDKSADDHNCQRCFILIWFNLPPIVMLMSQYNKQKIFELVLDVNYNFTLRCMKSFNKFTWRLTSLDLKLVCLKVEVFNNWTVKQRLQCKKPCKNWNP